MSSGRLFLDGAVELGHPYGADLRAVTLRQAQGGLSGKRRVASVVRHKCPYFPRPP